VTVAILNADKRIGTHVFTTVLRNDAGLRLTAVMIDNGDDANDLDRITYPTGCTRSHDADRNAATTFSLKRGDYDWRQQRMDHIKWPTCWAYALRVCGPRGKDLNLRPPGLWGN
jgi:hypothetical protein